MVGEFADRTRQIEAETADLDQHCFQVAAEETSEEHVLAVVGQVLVEVVLGQVGDLVAAEQQWLELQVVGPRAVAGFVGEGSGQEVEMEPADVAETSGAVGAGQED